jgi:hypothetical protein
VLWHCCDCSTAYAVGLPACPHCRSTSKEEDAVPKSHVHRGPSYEGHVDVSSSDTAAPEWAPASEPGEPVIEEPEPEPVAELAPRKRHRKPLAS